MARRPHLVVINESTVITNDQLAPIIAAAQKQVDQDFQPAWGIGVHIEGIVDTFVPNRWAIVIADTSDEANALGYHDLTPDDLPLGKVFAKTDQLYGALVSVTFTHELLEMLGDPYINLDAQPLWNRAKRYAYEVCDAVEADDLAYDIDGVKVSDFVLPEWFIPTSNGPWAHNTKLSAPLELAPGGYISVWEPATGWTQKYAEEVSGDAVPERDPAAKLPSSSSVPRVGSRRERRARGMALWRKSDPDNHKDARAALRR